MRNTDQSSILKMGQIRLLAICAGLNCVVSVGVVYGHRLAADSVSMPVSRQPAPISPTPEQENSLGSENFQAVPRQLSDAEAILQRGTLTVWVPAADPHRPANDTREYQWEPLLSDFKYNFPNFDLRFQVLEPEVYLKAMHPPPQGQQCPDVAFIDNFQELGPLLRDRAVLNQWGRSPFSFHGWWVVFRQAPNLEAGEAFLIWLSHPHHWKPWDARTNSIAPVDVAAVQALSQEAFQDFAREDANALWGTMDPAAGRFLSFGLDVPVTLVSVKPLMTFGNSRLAFVLLAAVGQGDKAFGMDHAGVVLRKTQAGWKVLLLLPQDTLPRLEELFRSFDHMGLQEEGVEDLPKLMLLAPADHAQVTRFPRAEIEWAATGAPPAGYVVESQFTNPGREHWRWSRIEIITAGSSEPPVRMAAPFGAGMQPHRWRVWAISRIGVVSISEWRIIDFTN